MNPKLYTSYLFSQIDYNLQAKRLSGVMPDYSLKLVMTYMNKNAPESSLTKKLTTLVIMNRSQQVNVGATYLHV